jgi:hypothetical protein
MRNKEAVIGSLAAVFIALIILNLYGNNAPITGYAVRSSSDVLIDLQIIAANDAFKVLGSGAKICAVVEMDQNTTYYYEITKTDGSFAPQIKYCADQSNDAVIIKLNSYDDFASFKSDSSAFLSGKINTGYYFFPSKYMQPGGAVNCDAEFQQRYCAAAQFFWTKEQLRSVQLGCCADYTLPADVQEEIENLKSGVVEKPETLVNITNVIITVVLLAVLVALVLMLLTKKKPKINPEIKEYVDNSRAQGFADDQIREALMQSGWKEKDIDNILGKTL